MRRLEAEIRDVSYLGAWRLAQRYLLIKIGGGTGSVMEAPGGRYTQLVSEYRFARELDVKLPLKNGYDSINGKDFQEGKNGLSELEIRESLLTACTQGDLRPS